VVPRQNSSGGKERLGKISKQGDRYLRQLVVIGATSVPGVVKQESNGEQRLGSGSAREEAAAPGYRGACQQ
jgi:transposase